MKSYKLLYAEFARQMIALLILPLLLFTPLVIILVNVKNLSDTALFATIFGMMGLAIVITVYVYTKHLCVLTSVNVSETGIDITSERKTLFYRFEHLFVPYSNIVSITDDEDVQHNNRQFYTIRLKHPSRKLILTAPKKQSPVDMQQFSFELHRQIQTFNTSSQALGIAPIKDGSFYAGTFAKVFTVIIFIVMIAMAVGKVVDPDAVPWYKMVWFYAISFAWLANFFRAKKKQNERATRTIPMK